MAPGGGVGGEEQLALKPVKVNYKIRITNRGCDNPMYLRGGA